MFLSSIHNTADFGKFFIEYNRIQCNVGAYTMFSTDARNSFEIVERKINGGTCPHIELTYTKIHRICTTLNGSHKRLVRADRRHYFDVILVHFGNLGKSISIISEAGEAKWHFQDAGIQLSIRQFIMLNL